MTVNAFVLQDPVMVTSTRGIRKKNQYREHQNDEKMRQSIYISQFLKNSQLALLQSKNNRITSIINDVVISTSNKTENKFQYQMGLIIDSNNADVFLRLNIGGTHFLIRNETVLNRKTGLLSLIVRWPHEKRIPLADAYLENTKEYYFERSASLFNVIYQFYLTGSIHLPENLCLKDVLNELDYWCIAPDKYLAECCCFGINTDQLDLIKSNPEMDQVNHFKHLRFGEYRLQIWNLIEVPSRSGRFVNHCVESILFLRSFLTTILDSIYDIFFLYAILPQPILRFHFSKRNSAVLKNIKIRVTKEIPEAQRELCKLKYTQNHYFLSSYAAQIFATLSVLFVFVSILGLVFGSLPEFQLKVNLTTTVDSSDFHVVETEPLPIFERLEFICIVWFIFEYVLKMAVSYDRLKTFFQLLNIIDLLAILPFTIEIALSLFEFNTRNMRDLKFAFLAIRVLRVLRVIRILKLGRYSIGLQVFGRTLKASSRQLSMMAMVVLTGVIFFGTLVYYTEKDVEGSQFYSIPASCWWIRRSYTDNLGKLVATGAIACGILVLALPITIIVDNFMKITEKETDGTHRLRRIESKDSFTIAFEQQKQEVIEGKNNRHLESNEQQTSVYNDININVKGNDGDNGNSNDEMNCQLLLTNQ
ncbi:hypothetical protein X798_07985 [Onchocerca flexuosa]|uniref:K+ channel tetramerization domain protein n=1 Tax=Onchocerca flexuosa TaxID=387005 RepID=A0A238BKK2_9BILA|nr:hypothetical protein X798_07985 [Onchocerca flexuosa]